MTKKCKKCNELKSISEFGLNSGDICISCIQLIVDTDDKYNRKKKKNKPSKSPTPQIVNKVMTQKVANNNETVKTASRKGKLWTATEYRLLFDYVCIYSNGYIVDFKYKYTHKEAALRLNRTMSGCAMARETREMEKSIWEEIDKKNNKMFEKYG